VNYPYLFDRIDTAMLLDCSYYQLAKLSKTNELPRQPGRLIRYSPEVLDRFIKARESIGTPIKFEMRFQLKMLTRLKDSLHPPDPTLRDCWESEITVSYLTRAEISTLTGIPPSLVLRIARAKRLECYRSPHRASVYPTTDINRLLKRFTNLLTPFKEIPITV